MRSAVLATALLALCRAADEPSVYTVPSIEGPVFLATFQDDVFGSGQFVKSGAAKYTGQAWEAKEFEGDGSIAGDKGLVALYPAKHYGITGVFKKPLVVKDQDLVLQYEVRLSEGLDCGGAYLKLLANTDGYDAKKLDSDTPYIIMFGPDKCGSTNKVHFILRHQNPVSNAWEEKHIVDAPPIMADKLTHLYTLVIRKDNSFSVYIDGTSVKDGHLLTDLSPPVNPSKQIDDPSDAKPADWVDAAQIPDESAVKPDDWDETAPATIVDEDAVKPEGWLDDAPEFVADPSAVQPEDWDSEEDGDWEAPAVANPACEAAPGCGKWVRPTKANPAYKGKWHRPLIANPAYVGPWSPRKIENPNYFEDLNPANLPAIAGVAIEIWTMSGGIQFDNVLVSHDEAAALAFGEKTWKIEYEGQSSKDVNAKKEQEKATRQQALETGTVVDKVNYYLLEGLDFAQENVVATVATVVVVLITALAFCCFGGSSDDDKEAKPATPAANATGTISDEEEEEETQEAEETPEEAPAVGVATEAPVAAKAATPAKQVAAPASVKKAAATPVKQEAEEGEIVEEEAAPAPAPTPSSTSRRSPRRRD